MARINSYPRIEKPKANDVFILDGADGTRTITHEDMFADVGELKTQLNQRGIPTGGSTGQSLRKKSGTNYDMEWADVGLPTDEQTADAVSAWLGEHPEATTTVQDHSLTYEKLVIGTLGYVTPEMFGAKGDGETDDTEALEAAFNSGERIILLKGGATYLVKSPAIDNVDNLTIIGYGATIKVNKDFVFQSYLQMCCLLINESTNIKIEGVTFDASWREIQIQHNLEVDTTLENYCVRLLEGNDGVTFYKCVFGNQLKVCVQTKGSYLGGDISDPSNIDTTFVPNKNLDIGYCTFGWNYTPGLHNGAIQFLELPQVGTDVYHKIHDNLLLMSGVHGMHIYYGNNNIIIKNNTVLNSGHCMEEDFYKGGGNVIRGYGIEVTSCHDVTIENNYVKNFIAGGIYIFNDAWYNDGDIYNISIKNNTVTQDADYSTEFAGAGISVSYCIHSLISGNYCEKLLQTSDHNTICNGITSVSSDNIIISDNIISECESGIYIATSNYVNTLNNVIESLTNRYGQSKGINILTCKNTVCNENIINRGTSELSNFDGISLANVENAAFSANNINKVRRGFMDNSGTVKNTTIFGNIFNDLSGSTYLWWGTHTGLVIDFVNIADN